LIDQEVELIFRKEVKSFTDEKGNSYPEASKFSRKLTLKSNELVKVVIEF